MSAISVAWSSGGCRQNYISKDFRNLRSDFRKIGFFAFQLAIQQFVDIAMQTVGHGIFLWTLGCGNHNDAYIELNL